MGFVSLVGVDEDGLDAEPARSVNIPVHVVTHADHLGRFEFHDFERYLGEPLVGLPESVMRGDDDGVEVAVQSHGLHLRQRVTGLGVGNEGHAVGGAQFVQHPLHVGVKLEAFPGDAPVELGKDQGKVPTFRG